MDGWKEPTAARLGQVEKCTLHIFRPERGNYYTYVGTHMHCSV